MSWSIERMGTAEKVREAVAADFDRCFLLYQGNAEGADILAVKERTLSAIDELDLRPSNLGLGPYAGSWGIRVSASGSRSSSSTSSRFEVTRIILLV